MSDWTREEQVSQAAVKMLLRRLASDGVIRQEDIDTLENLYVVKWETYTENGKRVEDKRQCNIYSKTSLDPNVHRVNNDSSNLEKLVKTLEDKYEKLHSKLQLLEQQKVSTPSSGIDLD
jgi:predicted nuclease with TOPRIM domain